MTRCILHVGMPKTGTSSIQETLFFELSDPRFDYFSAGEISTARVLKTLCAEEPLPMHFFGSPGRDPTFIERRRRAYVRQLDRRFMRTIRIGRDLVLSGEACWALSDSELLRLRRMLERHTPDILVIAYVRPWKDWLESSYQQRCKYACLFGSETWTEGFVPRLVRYDHRRRIESLDRTFGRENVMIRKYDPHNFPGGCVVRDFCAQAGIVVDERRIHRVNEAIRLDALRFYVAYGRFGNREGSRGAWRFWQHGWLMKRLQRLNGPRVRFHSSLVEPVLAPLLPQLEWLEKRVGESFREDLRKHDSDECIHGEQDLFRFSPESLEWLATVTDGTVPKVRNGEAAARHVGRQMHALRHRIPEYAMLHDSARAWLARRAVAWMLGR